MIHGELAEVVDRREAARGHVRMKLRAPRLAAQGLPGQFVNVRCGPLDFSATVHEDWESLRAARSARPNDPTRALLMRPFAIHRRWTTGRDAGCIEIL
ncbi:MAG TPA: hypothetical protein VMX57_06165, partial [Planctomycetota bacterium]|nr:hypothetical protein [Planctomycetota bacterium]